MTSRIEREPSTQIVLQRVRNRVIECLELAASIDRQAAFNKRADAPHEMLQLWDEGVGPDRKRKFVPPTFSVAEIQSIEEVQLAWDDVVRNTTDPMPPLDALLLAPHWKRLCDASYDALQLFSVRGRLSED